MARATARPPRQPPSCTPRSTKKPTKKPWCSLGLVFERRRFLIAFLALAMVIIPRLASASMGVRPETRVRDLQLAVPALIGAVVERDHEKHRSISPSHYDLASGRRLGRSGSRRAGAAAGFGMPGSLATIASDDLNARQGDGAQVEPKPLPASVFRCQRKVKMSGRAPSRSVG